MRTLWDLLPRSTKRRLGLERPAAAQAPPAAQRRPSPARPSAAERYDAMARRLLAEHGIRVRKWRSSMSGVAWEVHYDSGRVSRLIESPRPRGPVSVSIFLHEIGHHAIGFGVRRPRWKEEMEAWRWSLETMEREGVTITDRVRDRVRDSLLYALSKAKRRGLKEIPPELVRYLHENEVARGRRAARGGGQAEASSRTSAMKASISSSSVSKEHMRRAMPRSGAPKR
jgi:hypothetical protein